MKNTIQKPVICECCEKEYDYNDEPSEVKEGGTHICSDCWNEEEEKNKS